MSPRKACRACTSLGSSICGQFDAEKIVENAKRAFAVLILCYCDRSIIEEHLLDEGFCQKHYTSGIGGIDGDCNCLIELLVMGVLAYGQNPLFIDLSVGFS